MDVGNTKGIAKTWAQIFWTTITNVSNYVPSAFLLYEKNKPYLIKLLLNSFGYLQPNTFLSVIVPLFKYCGHGADVQQKNGGYYLEHMDRGARFPQKRQCV